MIEATDAVPQELNIGRDLRCVFEDAQIIKKIKPRIIPTLSEDCIPYLKRAELDGKAKRLIEILHINPYQTPPPYEKLSGDLKAAYFQRINLERWLVYEVFKQEQTVKIISLWFHYEF